LVDTGGLVSQAEGIDYLTAKQVHQAIEESHLVFFVVSARDGLTASDLEIAQALRKADKPVLIVANKMDGLDEETAGADFAALGMGDVVGVSAEHRQGLDDLMETAEQWLPPADHEDDSEKVDHNCLRLAIVGRPNVGKSTLVNRILGEERVLAFDQPGTTRDSISIKVERDGQKYELIDTAGVRRRSRISEAVEKFSTIKALQAIDKAHVVLLLLDASEGLTDQDSTLLGHVLQQGRALVLGLNKWDGLDHEHREQVKEEMDRRLTYASWARRVTLSALHGSGIQEVLDAVQQAWESAGKEFSTAELTRVLIRAVEGHQPPMSQGRTAKLRFAHSGGNFPPRIIIHGSRTETVPDSYTRYLSNTFIKHFRLKGTPLLIHYRNSENPYKDKKNVLTRRQVQKRQRMKKHVGKGRK
jgi:GTP-binding protein